MTRRDFAASLLAAGQAAPQSGQIHTVLGPIAPSKLGVTAIHEHVMVDFIGADQVSPSRYDSEEVFKAALPKLRELKERGCQSLVECTPAFLGRDALLLQRLSRATGINLITNTGFYGAANDKYVPKFAWSESDEQIAKRWIAEAEKGVDGSGIRPGFMKIGVDSGPLSEIDAKLIRAGAICHGATGLRLHVHTGNGVAAMGILEVLQRMKTPPAAFVWVHAQSEKDRKIHLEAARAGAWLEFDGINPKSHDLHWNAVMDLSSQGHAERLLISQDSGWYRVGEPGGGQFNGYTYMFDEFVPALRARGFGDKQVDQLLVANPARALTLFPRGK